MDPLLSTIIQNNGLNKETIEFLLMRIKMGSESDAKEIIDYLFECATPLLRKISIKSTNYECFVGCTREDSFQIVSQVFYELLLERKYSQWTFLIRNTIWKSKREIVSSYGEVKMSYSTRMRRLTSFKQDFKDCPEYEERNEVWNSFVDVPKTCSLYCIDKYGEEFINKEVEMAALRHRPTLEEDVVARDSAKRISDLFNNALVSGVISEYEWQLLNKHVIDRESLVSIAKSENVSAGAIKMRYHRVRERVMRFIRQNAPEMEMEFS